MNKTKTRNKWKLFAGMAALIMVLSCFMAIPVRAEETTVVVGLVAGPLRLQSVPAMNFGLTNTISTATLNLAPTDSTNYSINVQDLRGGAATGWNLTVNLQTFSCTSVTSDSLPGASLTVDSASVVTTDTANPATVASGIVTLASGGSAVKVLYAEVGKGLIDNVCTWALGDVKLNIPPSATHVAETHTANLVWTLTDGPGA